MRAIPHTRARAHTHTHTHILALTHSDMHAHMQRDKERACRNGKPSLSASTSALAAWTLETTFVFSCVSWICAAVAMRYLVRAAVAMR